MAVGVGTGKILGRVHVAQLHIGDYHFPCTITIMDDPPPGASEMPFLLGLDMMKRHTCQIDLERGCLRFRLSPGHYMETKFLHEKDLDEAQGGTKGFDAEKANERFRQETAGAADDDNNEVEMPDMKGASRSSKNT
jgi:DNA damage-inducible protein 1